jgi:L,D-transpeptidase ErfK/SrfK
MIRRALERAQRATTTATTALLVAAACIGCGPLHPASDSTDAKPVARAPENPTYLVLRVGERRLYMKSHDGSATESFPIAVGRTGHETPTGEFHVEEMIEWPDYARLDAKDKSKVEKYFPPGPNNPLGHRWIGFAHGPGWTVGIHGTPNPELLGQAVSGGCIRMRNPDVVRIYERVQLGTPVIVEP